MGRLESAPFDAAEGREYVDYLTRVRGECTRLLASGRLPDTDEMAAFLATAEQVLAQVSADVDAAVARGESVVVSRIPMTSAEHARMRTMNDSLRTLLEILEIRQTIELNRTPAVGRVAAAVLEGKYSE